MEGLVRRQQLPLERLILRLNVCSLPLYVLFKKLYLKKLKKLIVRPCAVFDVEKTPLNTAVFARLCVKIGHAQTMSNKELLISVDCPTPLSSLARGGRRCPLSLPVHSDTISTTYTLFIAPDKSPLGGKPGPSHISAHLPRRSASRVGVRPRVRVRCTREYYFIPAV